MSVLVDRKPERAIQAKIKDMQKNKIMITKKEKREEKNIYPVG
jgi:hypothetical protein